MQVSVPRCCSFIAEYNCLNGLWSVRLLEKSHNLQFWLHSWHVLVLSNSRLFMTTLDTVLKTWVHLWFIDQYVSAFTFNVKTVDNKWAGGVTQTAPEKAGSAHRWISRWEKMVSKPCWVKDRAGNPHQEGARVPRWTEICQEHSWIPEFPRKPLRVTTITAVGELNVNPVQLDPSEEAKLCSSVLWLIAFSLQIYDTFQNQKP